ncbi:MAG: hypothetical protein MUC31_06535 [Bacteroidales bacterium]|jgi:hypothetical protein|nr:hypothetical protein [Bacteroidales bacterium]
MIETMNHLFRKLFGRRPNIPPSPLEESFHRFFAEAVNVEWIESGQEYEAIFYEDGAEKIALFDAAGKLLELRVNMQVQSLPVPVLNKASLYGELMNAIRIHRDETVFYEIIYRNLELKRFTLLLTSDGKVIREQAL